MTLPRPQIALQGARGYLGRLPQSRQANGLAGGLLLVIGAVLLAIALMTIFWQDPVTAVFTQHEQKVLSAKLAAAEKAPVAGEHTERSSSARNPIPSGSRCWLGISPSAAKPVTRSGESGSHAWA